MKRDIKQMNKTNFTGSSQAYKALNWILSYNIDDAQIPEYNEMVSLFGDGAIHELFLNDYIRFKKFGGIKYIFPVDRIERNNKKTYQWECIECGEIMNFIAEKSSFVSVPVACFKCGLIQIAEGYTED